MLAKPMPLVSRLLTLLVAAAAAPALHAPTALAGDDTPASSKCVTAEEARAVAAGDGGESAPPRFTRAFFARTLSIDVSTDGVDGKQLPISIEQVCSVPRALNKQAAQLAGNDGVALLYPTTQVYQDGSRLQGTAAANAVAGADTATLVARLATTPRWRTAEDGNKVPTFVTKRIIVTD
jgi:hypothetical protein